MKIYFIRKLVISIEFLLLLIWAKIYDLHVFSELTKIVKENIWLFLGGSIVTFGTLTYKLNFPEQDKDNILKKFPELDHFEITVNISIIYFIVFQF